MAATVAIPGRRVSTGETIYTEWMPRGGDCFIVRAQGLYKGGAASLSITAWRRTEEETDASAVQVTASGSNISVGAGMNTAIYLASTSTNGAGELVRLKLECTGGSAGDYFVLRIFPIIFFDGAKAY